MPLQRKNTKRKSAKVVEGKVLRTPDGQLMSLFESAKLPMITLNVEQFAFPETFLVKDAKRVENFEVNPETGWALKDNAGNKSKTGTFSVRLDVADGDAAQNLVDSGLGLTGLSTIQVTINKDIPIQKFEPDSTLLKLVKPVVMLGFGGQQADRILLVAEDCEFV